MVNTPISEGGTGPRPV